MSIGRHRNLIFACIASPATMFLAWLVQRGCEWLVSHDSVYYTLSDSGFRWLTLLAEVGFFLGPIPFLVAGFYVGLLLAFGSCIGGTRRVQKPRRDGCSHEWHNFDKGAA
jgi:hypothetical protein